MDNNEHVGRHAKLGDHWELVETEFDENYQPKHGKSWQAMAESAPKFASDSERQKQIVEKWDQRLEATKLGITRNETDYDELVDELLYNRDGIERVILDEDKAMYDERNKNAEGLLKILERGALNLGKDEPDAYVELTDGSVILKEDREAYDTYLQAFAATQPAYDELNDDCPPPAKDLADDEFTLILEGKVREAYREAPKPYLGIWDNWMKFLAGDLDRDSAEETLRELHAFLFEDKDRHVHLEERVGLVTAYDALNEYLHGEENNPHNEEEA